MGKHAYLIIAHNNWKQLKFLMNVLEDSRNDFFLLIDSKAKDFDRDYFIKDLNTSHLHFVDSIGIYWGDYSQIQAEVALLKAATKEQRYDYYHLISAVDMPLKSQAEMHSFFDAKQGQEFVDFDSYNDTTWAIDRTKYYYYFQKLIGRRRKNPLKILRDFIIALEKLFGVNRIAKIEQHLGKGANWFSITDNFARYVADNEAFIDEHFKQTFCADEVFIQTMLKMSPYKDNWYGFNNTSIQYQNLRYCDWGRGKPYTFKKEEFFELCKDEQYMFARKFGNDIISEDVKKAINKSL